MALFLDPVADTPAIDRDARGAHLVDTAARSCQHPASPTRRRAPIPAAPACSLRA